MAQLCSPWLQADDVTLCEACLPDGSSGVGNPAYIERGVLVASWLLYRATGYQFPGLCTDIVRPCTSNGGFQQLANPTGAGSRLISDGGWDWWGGLGCGCGGEPLTCGCHYHSNVVLPGTPVVDAEVTIDGAPFTAFKINNDRQLIRTDGGQWPCCQDLGKDLTEPGTWGIEYRYGAMPPPDGVLAAEILACEFAKAWEWAAGDATGECADCRLPRRLTSITREGMTAAVMDPFEFLNEGRFGIAEVDYFVNIVNAGRRPGDPGAKVLSAAAMFGGNARIRP